MNKTILWLILAVSAALFLYTPITTLLDVLETIGDAPAVASAVIEIRDRAIMQVFGFISLYVFLGALLHSHDMPVQKRGMNNHENQPRPQVRRRSPRIDPIWSFPAGAVIALTGIAAQGVLGVFDSSDIMNGIVLPVVYSVGVGLVSGFVIYLLLKYLD